jgi:hypothetical protein
MNIEEITNYLIKHRLRVPILRDMKASFVHDTEVPSSVKLSEINLGEYASEVFQYITHLQKQNSEIKSVLKELAVNDYNIHWRRDMKREILEIYFPDLIKTLPYYSGGD